PLVADGARREAQHRRCAGDAAGEEVQRHLRLPHRFLQDRTPVVGARLAGIERDPAERPVVARHRRPPRNDATTLTTIAPAASAAAAHISGRCFVVTTGSGGSPYTSASSSSRKNAPKPPTPSFGSWPYSCAPFHPCAHSRSTRRSARSRSSSSGPNWIESVGHAFAHAGS